MYTKILDFTCENTFLPIEIVSSKCILTKHICKLIVFTYTFNYNTF